jgi:hypothetical protein
VLALASPASARTIEIGRTKATATPACTGHNGEACQVITRSTGVQTQIGKVKDPMLIHTPGRIVAFRVQLGKLTLSQQGFFTQAEYGPKRARKPGLGLGQASVRLSVLRAAFRTANKFRFRLVAQTEDFKLAPYLGRSAQFAPARTLPVVKGDLIAITSSTWAPILSIGLDDQHAWRAARGIPCANTQGQAIPQNAQTTLGSMKQYFCNYRTARLTYTATEVVTP